MTMSAARTRLKIFHVCAVAYLVLFVASNGVFGLTCIPRTNRVRNKQYQCVSHALDFATTRTRTRTRRATVIISLSNSNNNNDNEEYSRTVRLREEVESPFSKVRLFFYVVIGLGAALSLAISLAQVGAALNGINQDMIQNSFINIAVDTLGIALVTFLYQRDLKAQESRLKRATKGAQLAKLMVRGNQSITMGDLVASDDEILTDNKNNARLDNTITTSLASLRRGRGIEKRVVIAVAGQQKVSEIVQEARQLEQALITNDLLIVPVILPDVMAPLDLTLDDLPNSVAVPVGLNWKPLIQEEVKEAASQGVNVLLEGFSIILKKNGRVGQRTRGIFLQNMVADVLERASMGMDIKNI